MYEFMDRLFNVAMPRIRDFRGVSVKAFDQHGNYTLGIRDQSIFPEVDQDKSTQTRGMNITFVVKNSNSADRSRSLSHQEKIVAKKSMIAKNKRTPKFKVRAYNRCRCCGRPKAFIRKFQMCRICFRTLALEGKLPGVTKSSW